MKTFLDAWLLEAPMGFSQELAGTVKIAAAETQPEAQDAVYLEVELQGGFHGKFWVLASIGALGRLLIAAKVTAEEPSSNERSRDTALWLGMVQQVAERAAKAATRSLGVATTVVAVREAAQPSAATFVSYALRFGGNTVPLAFADEAQVVKEKKTYETHAQPASQPPARGVELLLDIELEASLRFGSKEMPLSEVLELGPGDVVQLERHVSDPVDLIVGDKIVARGEVVLVNGNFGLRVTEVAEPRKSLESIRCLF